jgi:hypothetical protein
MTYHDNCCMAATRCSRGLLELRIQTMSSSRFEDSLMTREITTRQNYSLIKRELCLTRHRQRELPQQVVVIANAGTQQQESERS